MVVERNIEELYAKLRAWKSHLRFAEDEMLYIQKLLGSYIFEPRTPALFEEVALYKENCKIFSVEMEKLKALVLNHESHLRGIFECSRTTCDEAYYKKYCQLQERMARYFEDFLRLKTDLGKYAGNVLKRRKPGGIDKDDDDGMIPFVQARTYMARLQEGRTI